MWWIWNRRMSCFPSVHNLSWTGHVCEAESCIVVLIHNLIVSCFPCLKRINCQQTATLLSLTSYKAHRVEGNTHLGVSAWLDLICSCEYLLTSMEIEIVFLWERVFVMCVFCLIICWIHLTDLWISKNQQEWVKWKLWCLKCKMLL